MFCSLKNRIELQGKFFWHTLVAIGIEKKNIHYECEISFLCDGRQSDSQCPAWFLRSAPAWLSGASAIEW